MSKKQEINEKRRKLCQSIINDGRLVSDWMTVRAAFMNGSLPHGVALAWVGERDAFLVNFKKRTAKEYVKDGKFLMKRLLLPLKIQVPVIETKKFKEAVHDGILRAVASGECPGCVNPGWGLTHNQFCNSLKDDKPSRFEYDSNREREFD